MYIFLMYTDFWADFLMLKHDSLTEVSDLIGFSFGNQRGEYTETHTQSVKQICGQPAADRESMFIFVWVFT